MKFSTVPKNILAPSASLSLGQRERYAWNLAFRLIDPIKVAIIEAVLQLDKPLAVSDLAAILNISTDLTRYHCKALTKVDVLDVAEIQLRLDTRGEELFFDFPLPPQVSSSSSSVSPS
jgi:Bacterial regulatory protein, arsR family